MTNKTDRMRVLELQHNKRDIEELMRDAYREHGSREKAAASLGLTRMTFINWEDRLGLDVSQEPVVA